MHIGYFDDRLVSRPEDRTNEPFGDVPGTGGKPVSPAAEPAPQVPPAPTEEFPAREEPVPAPPPVQAHVTAPEDVPTVEAPPARQRTGAAHPAPRRERKGPKHLSPKRRSGVGGFVVLLVLILGLTGLGVWINGGIPAPDWSGLWDLWDEVRSGMERPGRPEQEQPSASTPPAQPTMPGGEEGSDPGIDWSQDWSGWLDMTDIDRAPTGDGTTLNINKENGRELTASQVYERVIPSIVGIRVSGPIGTSVGTGVIMTENGYIVTNAHMVAGGTEASVLLFDNRRVEARLVGYDGETDLAVLKIEVQGLTPAEFGDSDALRVGDTAYAIGNPLGESLRGTMTEGIISAVNRSVSASNGEMTLLQTSAPINSGNSGGALCNAAGQVIGITNLKMMSQAETLEGLGFAIPAVSAKTVVDQIIARGAFRGWPMLGITVTTHYDNGGNPDGAEVISVLPKSDAYAQGIREGFIVTKANGAVVRTVDDLLAAKKDLQVGDILLLSVRIGSGKGREIEISVTMMSTRDMQ